MSLAKYDGVTVKLGEQTYVIPPLTIGAMRKLEGDLKRIGSMDPTKAAVTAEDLDIMVKIIHAALIRNYPDLKIGELDDILDLGNLNQVFNAVMAQSGLEKNAQGN